MISTSLHSVAVALLLLGIHAKGLAQSSTESIDSVVVVSYWHDAKFRTSREMALNNRVWLEAFKKGSSQMAVSHHWGKGGLQPAQGADRMQAFRFETEGRTRWNKTDFWGQFSYDRGSEDSTALRHQTRWNEDAPFYFASMRKNNYHRETYKLDATIQQQFMDGKLPVTVAVDYRIGSHYANNDPRGNLNDMNLNVDLGIGYRTLNWQYHMHGRMGYGSERVSVGYLDDKNNSGLERPVYTTWQMNGYGSATPINSNLRYDDLINRSGLGIHIKYEPNMHTGFYINANYVNEMQSFRQSDSSPLTYKYLNDYNKDIFDAQLLWTLKQPNNRWLTISLDAKMQRGADYNYEVLNNPNPNNYVYQQDQFGLTGNYSVGNNTFIAQVRVVDLNRADGSTGNRLRFTQGRVEVGYARYFSLHTDYRLLGQMNYAYQKALQHALDMPEINIKDITARIIYPDYLYHTAAVQAFSTRWVFSSLKVRKNWSIIAQADYAVRNKLIYLENALQYQPGKDWLMTKVGLSYAF